jgi:PAS domain S-box-containing protein
MRESRTIAENLMNVSEQTAQLLLESVRDYAIYMLDPEGRVTSWNAGARELKGYQADEIIGRDYSVFFTDDDREAAEPERELVAAASGRIELEGWRVRKDGTKFWADVVVTPLHDTSGKLIGFAKITRDLTDRHRREEERLRTARVEEALRVRDEFFNDLRRRLDTILMSLKVHVTALTKTVESVGRDRGGAAVESRLQMLEWGINKLERSVDEVVTLTERASERLAREVTTEKGDTGRHRAVERR